MPDLQELHAVSSRQHGLITHVQLRGRGWSSRQIDHASTTGLLRAIRVGVYALPGALPSWEQAVLAACLAGGPSTSASHLTAARLWGCQARLPSGIHVLSPPARRIRLEGVLAHSSRLLEAADLTRRHHIPVTSASRTVVDSSGWLGVDRTGRFLDLLLRRHGTRLLDVRACVARLAGPGRRRLSVVRAVLVLRLPGYDPGDSNLEVRVLNLIGAAGLPAPVQQHRVQLHGRRRYIDLAYPERRLAIEVDSWDVHGVRSAFTADRARANELEIAGWHVLRFTDDMADAVIVEHVRGALEGCAAA